MTSATSAFENNVGNLHDTTAPDLTASFIQIGRIKNGCGVFRIEFAASDEEEMNVTTQGFLNGIIVKNTQIVLLQFSDEAKINRAYGVLKLAAPVFSLVVTGIDDAGNSNEITMQYNME